MKTIKAAPFRFHSVEEAVCYSALEKRTVVRVLNISTLY
jgi:hypothetical protein